MNQTTRRGARGSHIGFLTACPVPAAVLVRRPPSEHVLVDAARIVRACVERPAPPPPARPPPAVGSIASASEAPPSRLPPPRHLARPARPPTAVEGLSSSSRSAFDSRRPRRPPPLQPPPPSTPRFGDLGNESTGDDQSHRRMDGPAPLSQHPDLQQPLHSPNKKPTNSPSQDDEPPAKQLLTDPPMTPERSTKGVKKSPRGLIPSRRRLLHLAGDV